MGAEPVKSRLEQALDSSAATQPEASICWTALLVQLTSERAIKREPETTPFVKEQQSRAALPLLVQSALRPVPRTAPGLASKQNSANETFRTRIARLPWSA